MMDASSKRIMGSDTSFDVAGRAEELLSTTQAFKQLCEPQWRNEEGKWGRLHMPEDWTEQEQDVIARAINEYGLDSFIENNMLRACDGAPDTDYNEIAGPVVGLLAISSGANMTDEEKIAFIMAARQDSWAKSDSDRKAIMNAFSKAIHAYDGTPVHWPKPAS